jgi:hypothetical protein
MTLLRTPLEGIEHWATIFILPVSSVSAIAMTERVVPISRPAMSSDVTMKAFLYCENAGLFA